MSTLRYAMGMELALPDPTEDEPGGYTRESLLAAVVKNVADRDDYELRLLLHSDVSVDCPHDVKGEMVFIVAPGVGGPWKPERAAPVIAEADALGRSGELDASRAALVMDPIQGAERALILPNHC